MDEGLLAKKQQIKKRIEEFGRIIGIPDPSIDPARIVEIAAIEKLTEETRALRVEMQCWHGESSGLGGLFRKGILYIAGLMKKDE